MNEVASCCEVKIRKGSAHEIQKEINKTNEEHD